MSKASRALDRIIRRYTRQIRATTSGTDRRVIQVVCIHCGVTCSRGLAENVDHLLTVHKIDVRAMAQGSKP